MKDFDIMMKAFNLAKEYDPYSGMTDEEGMRGLFYTNEPEQYEAIIDNICEIASSYSADCLEIQKKANRYSQLLSEMIKRMFREIDGKDAKQCLMEVGFTASEAEYFIS